MEFILNTFEKIGVLSCTQSYFQVLLNWEFGGEVINIGTSVEFITINELTKMIADKLNFKLNPIYVSARPQ